MSSKSPVGVSIYKHPPEFSKNTKLPKIFAGNTVWCVRVIGFVRQSDAERRWSWIKVGGRTGLARPHFPNARCAKDCIVNEISAQNFARIVSTDRTLPQYFKLICWPWFQPRCTLLWQCCILRMSVHFSLSLILWTKCTRDRIDLRNASGPTSKSHPIKRPRSAAEAAYQP